MVLISGFMVNSHQDNNGIYYQLEIIPQRYLLQSKNRYSFFDHAVDIVCSLGYGAYIWPSRTAESDVVHDINFLVLFAIVATLMELKFRGN